MTICFSVAVTFFLGLMKRQLKTSTDLTRICDSYGTSKHPSNSALQRSAYLDLLLSRHLLTSSTSSPQWLRLLRYCRVIFRCFLKFPIALGSPFQDRTVHSRVMVCLYARLNSSHVRFLEVTAEINKYSHDEKTQQGGRILAGLNQLYLVLEFI